MGKMDQWNDNEKRGLGEELRSNVGTQTSERRQGNIMVSKIRRRNGNTRTQDKKKDA